MIRGPLFALLASLCLAACGGKGPIPDTELQIRIQAGVVEVEFGKDFPLVVTRIWSQDLVPVDFQERSLHPLALRLVKIERREDERRVEEVRHYRAHLFALEDLALGSVAFQAYPRDGGPPREARSDELRIALLRSLDAQKPGPPELPRAPFAQPLPATILAGALALALGVGLLLWRWLSARRALEPAPAPRPAAHEEALARLGNLAALVLPDGDEAENQAFHVEAAGVLRAYLENRFEVCRPEMTSEEFLASPRTGVVLTQAQQSLLAAFLSRCDLVKFARLPSTAEERARLLEQAGTFVQETKPGGANA